MIDEEMKKNSHGKLFLAYIGLLAACLLYAIFARPDWEIVPVAILCTVMAIRHLRKHTQGKGGSENDQKGVL
jgi:hypothetical protein